jgi:hypothetical protein
MDGNTSMVIVNDLFFKGESGLWREGEDAALEPVSLHWPLERRGSGLRAMCVTVYYTTPLLPLWEF